MATYMKSNEFVEIANLCNCDIDQIYEVISEYNPKIRKRDIAHRITNYRRKGLLPLDSGNYVSKGEVLKSTSTMYDDEGNIILQWVKTDADKENQFKAVETAIKNLTANIIPKEVAPFKQEDIDQHTTTMYICNDLHFGMLSWGEETNKDWDTSIAEIEVAKASNYLVEAAPKSKYGLVVDLGDLTESDNTNNTTAKSGNALDTDSRLPKVLRVAYTALINLINKALTKHEIVYFYNIVGNHSFVISTAVREVILQYYKDEPRVIVDSSANPIKYHHFGKNIFQFVHGDSLKMKNAGEVLAVDCAKTFSNSVFRYSFFGHTHVDSVIDGKICKAESFRNLPSNNYWAHDMGYRRQLGTMKSITFKDDRGEISRNTYTIT